jgi:penicillin-binding protein 1C
MKRLEIRWKKGIIAVLTAIVFFFALDMLFPVRTGVEYAPVVLAKDGTPLYTFLTKDQQWRMKAGLDEITPELEEAIIFKEDKYFWYHPGCNPLAICRALVNNMIKRRKTSGASTITMQVARMLEPKKRSYLNKVIELFRATQLELHYSKKEILQMYLNLVPYGSNIQGVKAASLLYFSKTPDQLSLAEITSLSIIPNRPNSLVMGKDNQAIVKQRNKWLHRFAEADLFEQAAITDALREPLTAYRHEAPKTAPQFAWRMRRQHPGLDVIRTALDYKKQVLAEDVTGNYMNILKLRGINNAAVMVVDNQTREVLCYLGSSDYFDRAHNGQVDGIIATRSPGSALKPLLYALCMDHGLITPHSVMYDVPVNFHGYSPENYDLAFHGEITAEDALRKSLNIPAVKLLDQLGVQSFVGSLTGAGFNSVWRFRKKMGLSMILGGCGVRLEEMTCLYSAFANNGSYAPPVYLAANSIDNLAGFRLSKPRGQQIISPASCYLLTNILLELHRPDLPNLYDQAINIPRVAWKTGTSYGRKDGWSIGYNKRYTVGVWIGNFSGQGVTDLSGAGAATPLLFQLFNALDHNPREEWVDAPEDVSFRLVCAKTGKLPNEYCTDQVMDHYLPGVSSNDVCDHLKQVYLSPNESFSYCTSCLPPSGYKTKLFDNISQEVAAYFESMHIPYTKLPPHNPVCTRLIEGEPPVINSLVDNMTYIIVDKGEQKLQLSCTASNDVQKVYWYVNDKFLSAAASGEKLLFNPGSPALKISCTDDKGRNTHINIRVKFI